MVRFQLDQQFSAIPMGTLEIVAAWADGEVVTTGEERYARNAAVGQDNLYYVWTSNGDRTTGATWDDTERGEWTIDRRYHGPQILPFHQTATFIYTPVVDGPALNFLDDPRPVAGAYCRILFEGETPDVPAAPWMPDTPVSTGQEVSATDRGNNLLYNWTSNADRTTGSDPPGFDAVEAANWTRGNLAQLIEVDFSFCERELGNRGNDTVTTLLCVEDATTAPAPRFIAWHQGGSAPELAGPVAPATAREQLIITTTPPNTISDLSRAANQTWPVTVVLNGVAHWAGIAPNVTRMFTFTAPSQITFNRAVAGYDLSTRDTIFVDYTPVP